MPQICPKILKLYVPKILEMTRSLLYRVQLDVEADAAALTFSFKQAFSIPNVNP